MTEEREYLGPSLNPSDSIRGGLFDNKAVTFQNCRFEMFDYAGAFEATPALLIDMLPDGGTDEDVHTEPYTVGKKDFWTPTDDGEWIKPVGSEKEIRDKSNVHVLMQSLQEGGMPMSILAARKISALNGLKAFVVRKEISGREDLYKDKPKTRRGADGKEYAVDNKKLLVERVIALPDEAAATAGVKTDKKTTGSGKKGSGAKAKDEKKGGATLTGDVAAKAKEFIVGQIVKNKGKVDKKELPNAAFVELGQDPDRNNILPILFQNEAIVALGGLAIDDSGVITLAG